MGYLQFDKKITEYNDTRILLGLITDRNFRKAMIYDPYSGSFTRIFFNGNKYDDSGSYGAKLSEYVKYNKVQLFEIPDMYCLRDWERTYARKGKDKNYVRRHDLPYSDYYLVNKYQPFLINNKTSEEIYDTKNSE